jgi:hypothetical protein
MKLSKLVDPQYQAIIRKLASQEIPLRTAFKLRGIIKVVTDELTKYEEVRSEALKRFGEKKEDGSLLIDDNNSVRLSGENKDAFVAELNALLLTEIEVGKLKLGELGDKASLTAQELIVLDELITE